MTASNEPGSSSGSRTQRRVAARRKRVRIAIAGGLALVLFAVLGAVLLSSGGGSDASTEKAAAPTTTTTTQPASTTTTLPPPSQVATTRVPNLQVYDAPSGTKVVTTLSPLTDCCRQPRTLLVTATQGDWLQVLLPQRPNGSQGWIRSSDVSLTANPYRITVSLKDHKVTMYKDGKEVLESAAVIGSPRTPTPLGTFYITDPVDLRTNPGTSYGVYALGLSGYSEVLYEFNGGPGQIAIHGTNNPSQVGQDISNGCVRVPNDVIMEIANQAPLGTPVEITA